MVSRLPRLLEVFSDTVLIRKLQYVCQHESDDNQINIIDDSVIYYYGIDPARPDFELSLMGLGPSRRPDQAYADIPRLRELTQSHCPSHPTLHSSA